MGTNEDVVEVIVDDEVEVGNEDVVELSAGKSPGLEAHLGASGAHKQTGLDGRKDDESPNRALKHKSKSSTTLKLSILCNRALENTAIWSFGFQVS